MHVSSILDHFEIYASDRKFSPLIPMHVHDMIRHVLTILCFVHVSSILDHLEIYASGRKFSPLIAMYVHDMIRHVLTILYFVDVSSMPISTVFRVHYLCVNPDRELFNDYPVSTTDHLFCLGACAWRRSILDGRWLCTCPRFSTNSTSTHQGVSFRL